MAESVGDSLCNVTPRRRNLFPSTHYNSDDFSDINPLINMSEIDSQDNCSFTSYKNSDISDYIILENINDTSNYNNTCGMLNKAENSTTINTPTQDDSNYFLNCGSSPSLYSQYENVKFDTIDDETLKSSLTPLSKSPNYRVKTPQDVTNENCDIPKLIRKSPFKSSSSTLELGKRKLSLSPSPEIVHKYAKLDIASKVRTTLFSQLENQQCLSTKSFYSHSKNEPLVLNNIKVHQSITQKKIKIPSTLCSRRRLHNKFGQINAGVRHKIRKPKRANKVSKTHLLQAALNIMNNSSLNEYINDSVESHAFNLFEKPVQTTANNPQDGILNNKGVVLDNDHHCSHNEKNNKASPPDPNKKFFKFRHSSATVTVDKHMKLKVDDGKICFINNEKKQVKRRKTPNINFDATDLVVPDDSLISSENIDTILTSLNADCDKENEDLCQKLVNEEIDPKLEQFVLHAYNSVSMSENSIHLHSSVDDVIQTIPENNFNKDSMLLSPTSVMCNMASDLALSSPKKGILHSINNETSEICVSQENDKLFPIFYKSNLPSSNTCKSLKNTSHIKKLKPLPKGQMLLDAGQKKFGATQCYECKLVYHMGDPNDELMHLDYHNSVNILRFNGWKDERIVSKFLDSRIIRVLPSDPKPWQKKVNDLLEVINRDLGYYEMPVILDNNQVFLYIKNKTIVGCLCAEYKSTAYTLLSNEGIDICSETSCPIKCGVSRIWVLKDYRRQGIATSLLNCLRGNFMYGYILAKNDIAFSSPTEGGKALATKYFDTPNFYVYIS